MNSVVVRGNLIMFNKILGFIKNKNKIATIILTIIMLVIICIPLFIGKLPLVSSDLGRIEIVEIIAQIFASLFVIIGSFIALSQLYIYRTTERGRVEDEKIERALKLSEYYKNNVLEPYAILLNVYKKAGIFDILQKEKNRMLLFTAEEMSGIFSESELKKLENIFTSQEFVRAMISINEILSLNISGVETKVRSDENGRVIKNFDIDINKALNDFHINYVGKLMNNMEQFAMYFTHNIADESVVYQSLYPTYIEMCITLYYDISKCSQPGKAQLYRNVQKLYLIWLNKTNHKKEIIDEQSVDHGTISRNRD